MGGMSISRLAVRRAGGRRGRTGRATAAVLTVTALLGVGACSAGSSSSQVTPSASESAQGGGAPQATGPLIPAHSTLHWHSCAGTLGQEGVPDCTMLSV